MVVALLANWLFSTAFRARWPSETASAPLPEASPTPVPASCAILPKTVFCSPLSFSASRVPYSHSDTYGIAASAPPALIAAVRALWSPAAAVAAAITPWATARAVSCAAVNSAVSVLPTSRFSCANPLKYWPTA
ncbi:hypothetical protein [Neisseria dentiae]|uniref:hypothetical protein n=1 Tax=Neisseria dentiae TaxID=194197 RepID=UPI00211C7909|nr:hypothetical protein [Neisseria dentiae]MCQ9327735.1 hypothetical protein [Neisseria dentiae]